MTAEIIQLDKKKIEELQQQKVIGEFDDDVELDPVAGLPVIGQLTVPEIHVYTEMLHTEMGLADMGKELSARVTENAALAIRESDAPEQIMENLHQHKVFANDEEAEDYFYEVQKFRYLESMFWFTVRERVQIFASRLTIRAGFQICDSGLKYLK